MDNNERSLMKLFKEDSIILREGEESPALFKILSGKVALYINYGKENEYFVGIAGEQKCVGEVSLLSGKPSPHTAVALTDVMTMQITSDQLEGFIVKNTHNAMDIMNNMAKSIMMLSGNINLMTEEFADLISRIRELEKSDESNPEIKAISQKVEQYKMSALTGGSYYI